MRNAPRIAVQRVGLDRGRRIRETNFAWPAPSALTKFQNPATETSSCKWNFAPGFFVPVFGPTRQSSTGKTPRFHNLVNSAFDLQTKSSH
jgi:hypothetical protein